MNCTALIIIHLKKQKTVENPFASLDWLTLFVLTPALLVCLTSQRNYAKCSSVYPEDALIDLI